MIGFGDVKDENDGDNKDTGNYFAETDCIVLIVMRYDFNLIRVLGWMLCTSSNLN